MKHGLPSTSMIRKLLILPALILQAAAAPNIILIYADDLGYGDPGCYGGRSIPTPHIDRLAANGMRFTSAYATSSTCTPSRYALLTGRYPWKREGTGILPGDASMIIPPGSPTLASVLKAAGYRTGVVGKWHLGLGTASEPVDWNASIKAGPQQIGFDHCFIMAATGDRVPTVYVENDRVRNLDPADPIQVSYKQKVGNLPTGRENPGQRKFGADDQHSDTITHGVSRIGFMSGGAKAMWKDDELGDEFTAQALKFIEREKERPFFLFFALHEPHVPRVPAARFVGKSGLGPRGDAIVQLDSHVGAVVERLERLKLLENTLIILSSDNGPVLDDGYEDGAVAMNGDHKPAGPLSGGKYSKLEAGTRVPMIVSWPGRISTGVSDALFSQVDFTATFAALVGHRPPPGDGLDALDVLLGKNRTGRSHVVQHGMSGLALREGDWKFIPASKGAPTFKDMRSGNSGRPQLYQLSKDPGETDNLAESQPELCTRLATLLSEITSRP